MDDLSTRTAWAIKVIKEDRDLGNGITDIALAKILGTDKNTIARYRHKKSLPQGKVIENLVTQYHFNPQWLLKGEGEPFPGARAKYPEVCGPEYPGPAPITEPPVYIKDGDDAYRSQHTIPGALDFKISDDLHMAARVLESGTAYATTLHLNIHLLARALRTESRMLLISEGQTKLETEVADLKATLKAVQKENDALKSRVNHMVAATHPTDPDPATDLDSDIDKKPM